mgnify:CR=1 FL=1
MKVHFRQWFLWVTTVIAMLVFVAATYAWFSTNKKVSTSTATARTGEETMELELSETGGSDFRDSSTVNIIQVNKTDSGKLLPVSTADLNSFVTAPVTVSGNATAFELVRNEEDYYHGRLYLRAAGSGWSSGTKLRLYLDQSDGVLGKASSGLLLNASRLGLKFSADGESTESVILRLSDNENPSGDRVFNTVVNGKTLGDGQVLSYSGGSANAVSDPSKSVDDYTITWRGTSVNIPDTPLVSMKLDKVYTLDVYFYLEGCDPDCSNSISFDAAQLHLAFYGMISQEGSR